MQITGSSAQMHSLVHYTAVFPVACGSFFAARARVFLPSRGMNGSSSASWVREWSFFFFRLRSLLTLPATVVILSACRPREQDRRYQLQITTQVRRHDKALSAGSRSRCSGPSANVRDVGAEVIQSRSAFFCQRPHFFFLRAQKSACERCGRSIRGVFASGQF